MGKKSKQSLSVKGVAEGNATVVALPHNSWRGTILLLLGSIGFVMIVLGVVLLFRSFATARIAGITVNETTTKEGLKNQIEQYASAYKLQIKYPNDEVETASLADMGLSVNAEVSAEVGLSTYKPKNILKRLIWWKPQDTSLIFEVKDKKFDWFIKAKATKVITPYKNAKLKVSKGKIKVVKQKTGSAYTFENVEEAILQAASSLRAEPLQAQKLETTPPITEAETETAKKKLESILSRKVVFKVESQSVTAKPKNIGRWIELTPVEKSKTIDITINSGKILEYLNDIAAPYITPPSSQIVLKKSGGGTVVLISGKSGIDINNKNAQATKVAKSIMDDKDITINAVIDYAPYKTIEAASYPKWLVVDVTNKRMYAYEQKRLVRTFLISAGAPQTPTPLGTHRITYKVRRQDMRGSNVDGSRYFQPNVEWVNYFAAGGYAVHGNYWRPLSYFGNVNSSHGCIGIVNSDASWVYSWAPVGTPVIVHS